MSDTSSKLTPLMERTLKALARANSGVYANEYVSRQVIFDYMQPSRLHMKTGLDLLVSKGYAEEDSGYYYRITDAGRAALKAANGVTSPDVQNLTASVEVYEQPAAPLQWDAEVTDASETLMPELDNVEWISAGDTVLVSAPYRKAFYGVPEVINVEAQTALVWHAQGGYYVGTFSLDDMKLHEKKTPETEVASAS